MISRRVDVVDEHQPVSGVHQQPVPGGFPRDVHALAREPHVRGGRARLVQYEGRGAARLAWPQCDQPGAVIAPGIEEVRAGGRRRDHVPGGDVGDRDPGDTGGRIHKGRGQPLTVPRPGRLGDDIVAAQLAYDFTARVQEPQADRAGGCDQPAAAGTLQSRAVTVLDRLGRPLAARGRFSRGRLVEPVTGSGAVTGVQSAGAGVELRVGPVEQAAATSRAHAAAPVVRYRRGCTP